jgi:hypothetical protein
MPSKARAVICLAGIIVVLSFADVASAGPRRWYDGSRGGGHWQRRSVRLGWNPGWAGYNGRRGGYGGRHAYVRMYGRGYNRTGQQFGLAIARSGTVGFGASSGSGAGYGTYGSGQGYSGGYSGSYGSAGGASNTSGAAYNSGAGYGGNNIDSPSCDCPNGSNPNSYNGNGNSGVSADGPIANENSLDDGRSLTSAMNYRPASYCSFCYGNSSAGPRSSPSRKTGPPSRRSPDRTQQLLALGESP